MTSSTYTLSLAGVLCNDFPFFKEQKKEENSTFGLTKAIGKFRCSIHESEICGTMLKFTYAAIK